MSSLIIIYEETPLPRVPKCPSSKEVPHFESNPLALVKVSWVPSVWVLQTGRFHLVGGRPSGGWGPEGNRRDPTHVEGERYGRQGGMPSTSFVFRRSDVPYHTDTHTETRPLEWEIRVLAGSFPVLLWTGYRPVLLVWSTTHIRPTVPFTTTVTTTTGPTGRRVRVHPLSGLRNRTMFGAESVSGGGGRPRGTVLTREKGTRRKTLANDPLGTGVWSVPCFLHGVFTHTPSFTYRRFRRTEVLRVFFSLSSPEEKVTRRHPDCASGVRPPPARGPHWRS